MSTPRPIPVPDAALAQHVIVLGRAPPKIWPTAIETAYAAGFFDGEGNICIAANRTHRNTDSVVYNMRVGASQNAIEPLLWFRERWGGSVQPIKRKTVIGNTTYIWSCFAIMAADFLADVLPYLQVKKERAALALEFQSEIFNPGRSGHTKEHRACCEAARKRLNMLNSHKPMIHHAPSDS